MPQRVRFNISSYSAKIGEESEVEEALLGADVRAPAVARPSGGEVARKRGRFTAAGLSCSPQHPRAHPPLRKSAGVPPPPLCPTLMAVHHQLLGHAEISDLRRSEVVSVFEKQVVQLRARGFRTVSGGEARHGGDGRLCAGDMCSLHPNTSPPTPRAPPPAPACARAFMSRWTMPRPCRYSSPRRTGPNTLAASASV